MSCPSIENKRKFFRVYLKRPIEGTIKIKSLNGKEVNIDKSIYALVIDISAGGLKIKTSVTLPLELNVCYNISFTCEEEYFSLDGTCVWRKADNYGNQFYGFEFDIIEPERQRLIKCLNSYQVKNSASSKKGSIAFDKFLESSIQRIIEAFPYPAIIITSNREIVTSNEKAKALGYISGKCHSKVFSRKEICRHCCLDKCEENSKIYNTSEIINIDGEKYILYWLSLDGGFFLHYFKEV